MAEPGSEGGCFIVVEVEVFVGEISELGGLGEEREEGRFRV